MSKDLVAIAQASYARCCDVPEFFAAFYTELFATCPPRARRSSPTPTSTSSTGS